MVTRKNNASKFGFLAGFGNTGRQARYMHRYVDSLERVCSGLVILG